MVQTARITKTSTASRRISILGATGSIGDSTLRVIDKHPERYEIVALSAQENADKLIELAERYRPKLVAIGNKVHAKQVQEALAPLKIKVAAGAEGIEEAASLAADISVCAIVGAAGLLPAMRAVEQGGSVALANKESLVCAGDLFMAACKKHGTTLLPIDSEHNAIFQVLATEHKAQVEKITLTASGGPLLNRPLETLKDVTPEEAVNHPKWNMGAKISVDSATMMNKGLELIEAHYLFAMPPEKLDVVIHPESIVHSLVHYADGSVLAQLGMPDMRIPIGHVLAWPERLKLDTPKLDLLKLKALHFQEMEEARYPCLTLARQALSGEPIQRITLNAANEVAVSAFLQRKIAFTSIAKMVASTLEKTPVRPILSMDDVLAADKQAREIAEAYQ